MDPSPEKRAAHVPLVARIVKGGGRASAPRTAVDDDPDGAMTADTDAGKQGIGTPCEATLAGRTGTPETGTDSRPDSDRGSPPAPAGVVSGVGRGAERAVKEVTGGSAPPVRKPSIDDVHG